jgi:hypothetical protein
MKKEQELLQKQENIQLLEDFTQQIGQEKEDMKKYVEE